jgi:hypothetical protein
MARHQFSTRRALLAMAMLAISFAFWGMRNRLKSPPTWELAFGYVYLFAMFGLTFAALGYLSRRTPEGFAAGLLVTFLAVFLELITFRL